MLLTLVEVFSGGLQVRCNMILIIIIIIIIMIIIVIIIMI